jgi:hypothetical protein
MGVVLMSKRELSRIEVLARLDAGRLTISAAAVADDATDASAIEAIP